MFELADKRVWVTGHRGMVGAAILRQLAVEDCVILTADRASLDLRRVGDVDTWMKTYRPDVIFHAAAVVGGIAANIARPGEFIFDNIGMTINVLDCARLHDVRKVMFIGSSCAYPRCSRQPIRETELMTGALEPSNDAYAIAKLAGIKMCSAYRCQYGCDFISVIPTGLYGVGDNLKSSGNHVVPAMMAKVDSAMQKGGGTVEIWGSGTPRRELLYVDDAAEAMVFLMKHYSSDTVINIGGGTELSILDLAREIADYIGYRGTFTFDRSRPDGMPVKVLDSTRLFALGWRPRTSFKAGLSLTYQWFCEVRDQSKRPEAIRR